MRSVPLVTVILSLMLGCAGPRSADSGLPAEPRPVDVENAVPEAAATVAVGSDAVSATPGYQPNVETGAAAFIESHPNADGRGVVVRRA